MFLEFFYVLDLPPLSVSMFTGSGEKCRPRFTLPVSELHLCSVLHLLTDLEYLSRMKNL